MKSFVYLMILSCCGFYLASASKCDRAPEGSSANKSPPDGRFKLKIWNEPVRYIPGETYNISLEGNNRFGQPTPHKFTGFFITVEKDSFDPRPTGARSDDDVGRFHVASSPVAKFSDKCPNLVTHTSSFQKSEVLVTWTAPAPGSGCLVFKSTVIEHRDVWFSDDGALSRVLCEDEADSGDTQPITLDECSACNEAKYELTFEGLWSRHTHPKDFPDNGWLTKFSDVIGASHTAEFRFWTYGEPASEGLKELVEHGSTRQLETELKDQGEHIRTIIKARGISYPNVTGKTFAVFRVDSSHHLVSLVSMIYPSPDWFVGVSGLELCLSNGSWVEEKILNLYPYDAGTDSGPTYISSDQPTIPKEAIRRIKPNQPNDPRSPFHDPDNKEMKPLARLYLTRQRLYEKNCDNEPTENQNREQDQEQEEDDVRPVAPSKTSSKKKCATKWGDWSECDSPCGKGKKTRQQEFRNPEIAEANGCTQELEIETQVCKGTSATCGRNEDPDENEAGNPTRLQMECKVGEWGPYSECSTPCGGGIKKRTRKFKIKHRQCNKWNDGLGDDKTPLEEEVSCTGTKCSGDLEDDKLHKKAQNRNCKPGPWSKWTKCSANCDYGEKVRVRIPNRVQQLQPDDNLQRIIKLYEKLSSKPNDRSRNRNGNSEDDEDDDEIDFDVRDVDDQDHPCYNVNLVERLQCGENNRPCNTGKHRYCLVRPTKDVCDPTKAENRWFYRPDTEDCALFTFTGCESHKNNFLSDDECLASCGKTVASSLQSLSLVGYGDVSEKVDCKTTHWKHEPCNATCGEGFSWKYRSIIHRPQNGGRPCPRTMVHLERCFNDCGNSISSQPLAPATHWHSQHHHHHHRQCHYSEWSAWSPCSKSCGDSGVRIRTRTVLNHLNLHLCNERLEEQRCEVMPCLVGNGYGYNYRSNV